MDNLVDASVRLRIFEDKKHSSHKKNIIKKNLETLFLNKLSSAGFATTNNMYNIPVDSVKRIKSVGPKLTNHKPMTKQDIPNENGAQEEIESFDGFEENNSLDGIKVDDIDAVV